MQDQDTSFAATAVDLDNMDLSGVQTGFPLMSAGTYKFQIAEVEKKESKNKPGQFNLHIKLKLNETAKRHMSEETIQPGFPLNHVISLTQTEKYDPRRPLAEFKEAVTGSKDGAFGAPASYVGQFVTCSIKIEKDKTEKYPDSNRVARFLKTV